MQVETKTKEKAKRGKASNKCGQAGHPQVTKGRTLIESPKPLRSE